MNIVTHTGSSRGFVNTKHTRISTQRFPNNRYLPGTVFQQTDRGWTHTEDSTGPAGSPSSHAEKKT